jgi:hypothetical protein
MGHHKMMMCPRAKQLQLAPILLAALLEVAKVEFQVGAAQQVHQNLLSLWTTHFRTMMTMLGMMIPWEIMNLWYSNSGELDCPTNLLALVEPAKVLVAKALVLVEPAKALAKGNLVDPTNILALVEPAKILVA